MLSFRWEKQNAESNFTRITWIQLKQCINLWFRLKILFWRFGLWSIRHLFYTHTVWKSNSWLRKMCMPPLSQKLVHVWKRLYCQQTSNDVKRSNSAALASRRWKPKSRHERASCRLYYLARALTRTPPVDFRWRLTAKGTTQLNTGLFQQRGTSGHIIRQLPQVQTFCTALTQFPAP